MDDFLLVFIRLDSHTSSCARTECNGRKPLVWHYTHCILFYCFYLSQIRLSQFGCFQFPWNQTRLDVRWSFSDYEFPWTCTNERVKRFQLSWYTAISNQTRGLPQKSKSRLVTLTQQTCRDLQKKEMT